MTAQEPYLGDMRLPEGQSEPGTLVFKARTRAEGMAAAMFVRYELGAFAQARPSGYIRLPWGVFVYGNVGGRVENELARVFLKGGFLGLDKPLTAMTEEEILAASLAYMRGILARRAAQEPRLAETLATIRAALGRAV